MLSFEYVHLVAQAISRVDDEGLRDAWAPDRPRVVV